MPPHMKRLSGPSLVGPRPFSLALLDMPCYILNHFEHASREVPGVNSESRMTMQQERWLSVEEIAAHMGVNPDTVYKWIERKKLPAHKMGRLWKFKASEVDEWVRQGKAGDAK